MSDNVFAATGEALGLVTVLVRFAQVLRRPGDGRDLSLRR